MKKPGYLIAVSYSEEDEAYIAEAPALAGCVADGQTPEEAIRAVMPLIDDWLETAREKGWDIPTPLSYEQLENIREHQEDSIRKEIAEKTKVIVKKLLKEFSKRGPLNPPVTRQTTPWNLVPSK
jgi:predicted RNase H-like HicB family nuclease